MHKGIVKCPLFSALQSGFTQSKGDGMFDVQYNRNTFNPHLKKQWIHAHRADSLESAREYLKKTRAKFKNEFGYPSEVQYRIVKVTQ